MEEEIKKEEPKKSFKCNLDNKKIAIIFLCLGLLILVGAGYFYNLEKKSDIGEEKARSTITTFVNENLLQPGTEATVKSIEKEGGLYKAVITVGQQDITTYLTKDGKKFFPQAMDTAVTNKEDGGQPEAKEIPKSDKPSVDLYVMSFCPFGNKAEDTLKPAYDLLKNKVDFKFHYIVSTNGNDVQSLHGPKEVVQNEREACVLKNYGKDKWMDFVTYVNANCGSDGSCWETGAKKLGVATEKISACAASEGPNLMKDNEKASNDANASGSPTMAINGVETNAVYQYGNSEAYKKTICDAFNNAPEECSKTLSSEASTAEGGSCGN